MSIPQLYEACSFPKKCPNSDISLHSSLFNHCSRILVCLLAPGDVMKSLCAHQQKKGQCDIETVKLPISSQNLLQSQYKNAVNLANWHGSILTACYYSKAV